MHFVDRQWVVEARSLPAQAHPSFVVPFVTQVPNLRAYLRRHFMKEAKRVGLVQWTAIPLRNDVIAVQGGFPNLRNGTRPDAGGSARKEVGIGIPVVEVGSDGDAFGVGRPDGKMDFVAVAQVGAKLLKQPIMRALVKEVQV